jgi:transposase
MLPKEKTIGEVPEATARIARAAFAKGNIYMWIRDELGQIYVDEDFADLYDNRGQPGWSAWRLALICVMQFLEDLTDRQAAEAVRGRIDWKYALGLELEDSGFDFSVLSEFRARFVSGESEQRLLDRLLSRIKEKGWLKERSQQRTDSTHVLSTIRTLNRLESVAEMLRAALNAIATVEPEWLQSWVPQAWYGRYGVALEEYRIPAKSSERTALGEQVGRDGMELLERLWQTETPGSLRMLEASERLRQHWLAHFYYEEGIVKMRPAEWMPPAGRRFDSPYEPDSRYGNKRSQTWHGYKVHVSETCEPGQVHLITQVRTTPAHVQDIEMTAAIHAELARKSLLPGRHFVDAGYVDAELLVSSQRDYAIELIGPVRPDPSWQANQPEAYDASRFSIDWETRTVTCPQGQSNTSWTTGSDPWNNPVITVNFGKKTCRECPTREHCTRSLKYPRSLTLHPRDQQEALQKARQLQVTAEWRKEYQTRAGIEGTISQAVTAFGLRHNRYRGLARTRWQHVAIATAINLKRLWAWVQGVPHAQTRISPFAALNLPVS